MDISPKNTLKVSRLSVIVQTTHFCNIHFANKFMDTHSLLDNTVPKLRRRITTQHLVARFHCTQYGKSWPMGQLNTLPFQRLPWLALTTHLLYQVSARLPTYLTNTPVNSLDITCFFKTSLKGCYSMASSRS